MKISYIITPFENFEYLIRCVNSLYRQLGEDFEVVLAENSFGSSAEELLKHLHEKNRLTVISSQPESNEEKLNEAFSLISEESDYVMLIDVNTVVSPVCTVTVLDCEKADLIIPTAAIKKGSEFVLDNCEKGLDGYPPQRFCYGKEKFGKFKPEMLYNRDLFYLFIIDFITEKKSVKAVKEVCYYSEPFAASEQGERDFETVKENCSAIFDKLFKIDDAELRVSALEKTVLQLAQFLGSEDDFIGAKALSELQNIGNDIKDKLLLKKVFEMQIGFDINDFLALDYSEYEIYKSRIANKNSKTDIAPIDIAKQEKNLQNLANAVKESQKSIEAVRKDISGFAKSQNQAVAAVINTRQGYADPSMDIPQMYREGRLGLKTIIRSFNGWMKYKFGRKK